VTVGVRHIKREGNVVPLRPLDPPRPEWL